MGFFMFDVMLKCLFLMTFTFISSILQGAVISYFYKSPCWLTVVFKSSCVSEKNMKIKENMTAMMMIENVFF